MAEPIQHSVRPPRIGPDAHQELERLLQTCHEHGVLRLANDLVASNAAVMQVLVRALNSEASANVIQNLSVLAMALSRLPPEQFYRLVFAVKDGMDSLAGPALRPAPVKPPGLVGAYRMLHDESLWRAMTPLLDALQVFATSLRKPVDNPISDFSGKPGRSS